MRGRRIEDGIGRVFAIYVVMYVGIATYSGYLNLYMDSIGMSEPQIGAITSVATVVTFVAQLFWGTVADRVHRRLQLLQLLILIAAALTLLFYASRTFIFLAIVVSLFSVFYNPVTPLLDTITLEFLEGKKTDFGQVRIGGTLGYSFAAVIVGAVLNDQYRHMFWLLGLVLLVGLLLTLYYPRYRTWREDAASIGYIGDGTTRAFSIFRNPLLLALMLFNFVFSVGMSFYYTFYPIYFVQLGGSSAQVGLLMFAAAMTEVPILLICRKLMHRLGLKKLLLIASLATILRWILLSIVSTPMVAVAVNLLHGVGFTSFSYSSMITINESLPPQMRARGQSLYILTAQVLPRVLFGYVGGLAVTRYGISPVLRFNALTLAATLILFLLFAKKSSTESQ